MNELNKNETEEKCEKWDFEDYAFTIATVVFFAPVIIGVIFAANDLNPMNMHRFWPFSWMSFMFAWSACLVKDVIDIKNGAKGANGDLENAVETASYVAITTVLLLFGAITGQMYSSWLAGPITLVMLAVLWPALRHRKDRGQKYLPTIPIIILTAGIIAEVILGGWIAFPVSWILICAVKVYKLIRKYKPSEDVVTDIMYYSFSIIFISISLVRQLWIISWLGYPLAVIISKIVVKIGRNASI